MAASRASPAGSSALHRSRHGSDCRCSHHAIAQSSQNALSTIPWRRGNVKHTNNELYVDIIEQVTATIAPSGRPLAARSNGTIAFTSKLSGIPDITLCIQAPNAHKQQLGGKPNSVIEYPVFHPCVRLNRWREHPGELSFVPPDGKFVLASYEVNLLPSSGGKSTAVLQLPVQVEMKTAIGADGDEFEVRVLIWCLVIWLLGRLAAASEMRNI